MTDSDEKLLRRYRDLPREEPPRALDDAILAASRRAVASRPTLSKRWAAPVSIAAVLVLAFGVTLEMQREEPGIEYKEAPAARIKAPLQDPAPRAIEGGAVTPTAPVRAPEPAQRLAPELRKAAPPRAMKELAMPPQEKEMARSRDEPQAFPQSNAPPASPASALDPLRDANVAPAPAAASSGAPAMAAPRAKSESFDATRAPARILAAPAEPERELERIAKLRDDGRNDEADRALDEFKRRHPDFRIPDATWSRVKPR